MIRVRYLANGDDRHFAWRLGEEFLPGLLPEHVYCVEADGEEAEMVGTCKVYGSDAEQLYSRLVDHCNPLIRRGYELGMLEDAIDKLKNWCNKSNRSAEDETAVGFIASRIRALGAQLERDWREPLTPES